MEYQLALVVKDSSVDPSGPHNPTNVDSQKAVQSTKIKEMPVGRADSKDVFKLGWKY